ncbi:MAG: hypothetical protein IK020_12285 [Clostridiales bacterium]|nr:hypothetical protein [Clostridiales bacterium]
MADYKYPEHEKCQKRNLVNHGQQIYDHPEGEKNMLAAEFHKTALFLRGKRLALLKGKLRTIPHIAFGKRKGKESYLDVIRIYGVKDGSGKEAVLHQFDIDSKNARTLIAAMNQRDSIEKELSELRFRDALDIGECSISQKRSAIGGNDARFSKAEFDKLVELNEEHPLKEHYFDGHVFRSKSEMIVAQFIKSMGLEYKYEVVVRIGDQVYYTDFAVYCPETGRFFLIEHLGMMSKDSYRMKNFAKITNYTMNGYIEGLDVLFIIEHGDGRFSADAICGKILGVIAAQARSIAAASVF